MVIRPVAARCFMDKSHSSHIFMFPFSLRACGSQEEIVESLLQNQWQRDKFEYQKGNYADNYSLQAYFYEFSVGAIIDDGTKYGVIESYRKEIGDNATYSINIPVTKDSEAKCYDLDVEKICLNIYDGKVAILSFHLENRKYPEFQDVLYINDLGRRIYPLFIKMGKNNDTEVDLTETKGQVLPDSIILDVNGISLKEDFEGYAKKNEHPFVLPKFISGILPECMQNVHWLLDDRMFVISWYGNDDMSERLKLSFSLDDIIRSFKEGSTQLDGYYDWYKYVHGFKHHAPNGYERLAAQLKETTYDRWASKGTLYGVTRYSFVCLTDSKSGYNYGRQYMKSMYYHMASLCLAQRTMILYFTNAITELSGKLNVSVVQTDEIFNRIKALNLDLIRFNNNIYFREVTTQQQGIDIYNFLQEQMEIDIDRRELNEEVAQLYQYVNMAGDQKRTEEAKKQNEKSQTLNFLATMILPFTVVTGIFGMNDFFEISLNTGTWIEILIGLVLCAIAIVIFYKKGKNR